MQDNNEKDDCMPLTFKENFMIFSMLAVFAVIWVLLMIALPRVVVIGYFCFMGFILSVLWSNPPKETSDSDF